ncbi:MAG: HlyD family efflux transporter periplasmic adaptor subunit, partial [Chloroflexi bacterium]|nr:HlyD family efflux transporter periplasmic adaptor subunit [Chloroflexota bacterium]
MRTLLDAFKVMKPWQIGLMAIVLIGAFGGTFGAYYLISGSDGTSLGDDQQLIPVLLGNLVNEVSVNGSLVFPNRETLSFGTRGDVAEVLIGENESVQEGQPLARLSAETFATLEQAVAQARIGLRNAEDALEELESIYTPVDIARAEAMVSDSRLTLDDAQESLSRLMDPTAYEVAKSEAAVSSARLSVLAAEEAMDNIVSGASGDDITAANSKIRSTSTTLANSERDLVLARSDWDNKLDAAQNALDTALDEQGAVYEKWLGVELSEEELNLGPEALLESWEIDLTSLFNPALRFQDLGLFYDTQGSSVDKADTPWNEFTVYAWLNLYPGDIVATCGSSLPSQTQCIQKEIDDAWDAFAKKRDDLDSLNTQAAKAIANAEEAVTRSQESLSDAQTALVDLQVAPDTIEVESKEKGLALALAALDQAGDDLAELTGSPDPLKLESKLRQVVLNQAMLDEAMEDLTAMSESADSLDVALREANVVASQAALSEAIQQLDNATLKAPWNGIITVLNIETGQEVNANTPVMEIVDPTVVEVDGIVDEIDVLFIQRGARARVTMDALPGQVLSGTISSIASEPQTQQGVVSYPLRIQVQAPAGLQLPEGLSAVARVGIRGDIDVLRGPLQS